jgi:hypothetical protein
MLDTLAVLAFCTPDDTFELSGTGHITDDELVDSFKGRGLSHGGNLEFMFLNSCGTMVVAQRLQRECGVPVVVGWVEPRIPAKQCVTMVSDTPGCSADVVVLLLLLLALLLGATCAVRRLAKAAQDWSDV